MDQYQQGLGKMGSSQLNLVYIKGKEKDILFIFLRYFCIYIYLLTITSFHLLEPSPLHYTLKRPILGLHLSGMQIFWLIFSSCHTVSQENDLAEWPLPLVLDLSRVFFRAFTTSSTSLSGVFHESGKKQERNSPLKKKKKKERKGEIKQISSNEWFLSVAISNQFV